MILAKLENNSAHRKEKLSEAILELIHQYPGTHKNKLKTELEKKGFSSISVIDKGITELENDGLITHRSGNKKHHYYIKGYENTKHHDKRLETSIFNLKKIITKFENTGSNYEQYLKNYLYKKLEDTTSDIHCIISEHESDGEHSVQYELEDSILNYAVEQYSKYKINNIQSKIKNAKIVCEKIKVLREKNLKAIKRIQEKNYTSKKKYSEIIGTLDEIKEHINQLHGLNESLEEIKSRHQNLVFRPTIRDMLDKINQDPVDNNIVKLLKILCTVRIRQDSVTLAELNDVIQYFQNKLNPIDKNMLTRKLENTKEFTESDIDWHVTQSSLNGYIYVDKDKIYPLFYLISK